MRVWLACFVAVMTSASAALALSCTPPDARWSYGYHAALKERYIVVDGQISFDWQSVPNTPKSGMRTQARMQGKQLSRGAFEQDFDAPVTLITRCAGPWCGGMAAGERYIAFLRESAEGYELELTPCPTAVFAAEDAKARRAILSCSRTGRCKAD